MSLLRIFIPVKFTQGNLDTVLNQYYTHSKNSEYSEIIFDLSILEWISTEEIAVLFSWIRNLQKTGKTVTVWLPYPNDLYKSMPYKEAKDIQRLKTLLPQDSPEQITRRTNRNIFLLSVWAMLDNIGLPINSFYHVAEKFNSKAQAILEKFSHRIIPFSVITSEKPTSVISNPFSDVLNGNKIINHKNESGPFDLAEDIAERLRFFDCYSPFENRIISNVITKELFANSLIHSNESGNLNGREECYFTLSMNNRWDNPHSRNFVNQFIEEKDPETLDFYKDKNTIFDDVRARISRATTAQLNRFAESREADLSRYNSSYVNKSYIEFTFLDYGDGIYGTLDNKFKEFLSENKGMESFKNPDYPNQLLEYAFFPESSRNQYDSRLENPELFPRGLYFLVDMVRRYKGLLTVRSGLGKIIYDFSDKIYIRHSRTRLIPSIEPVAILKDATRISRNENCFFPGTMVSIVLPERKKEDVSYTPVRPDNKNLLTDIIDANDSAESTPRVIFKPEKYEYINMLFLYEKVISRISSEDLKRTKGFDSYIYIELLEEMKKLSAKKCVVFIDFEFYPRTDNINQLLFYLTNSPYINEYAKAVIVNLQDSHTRDKNHKSRMSVLSDFKVNLYAIDNEPHIFRPIPCIIIDHHASPAPIITDIQWIGVETEEEESDLTQLLIGQIDSLPKKRVRSKTFHEGNVFAYNQDSLHPIFNTDHQLIEGFFSSRSEGIIAFINKLITNGSMPKAGKKPFLFQTATGSFQTHYLSFYESLHNKYIAKFLAKRLLDNFLKDRIDQEKVRFSKIITVTVSSQLIGVALRDLINEDPTYTFLKTISGNSIECCPQLVMLSSYYSFEDEKPFNKINHHDKVLIVNDVISTGSLISKLSEGIIKRRHAKVIGVMSIADCRAKFSSDVEAANVFANDEAHYFNLASAENGDLTLRKFKRKIDAVNSFNQVFKNLYPKALKNTELDIERINPLLNTVVGFSDDHAENQRILFKEPTKILPEDQEEAIPYQEKYFRLGHFVQNLSHNSYLTDMKSLFADPEGTRLIKILKNEIDHRYSDRLDHSRINELSKLFSIQNMVYQLADPILEKALTTKLQAAISGGAEPTQLITQGYTYRPDFIFYPIFSGIENVPHQVFHDTFGTDFENIIGLQRFDTDKGWRFPFPPKRFNQTTRGKTVLILDSGALTGESLVQMVDSLSFLEVARIDVLSIIGRIEDYNREFFSRIKVLKIKKIDQKKNRAESSQGILNNGKPESVSFANLNILFGINLHIPVYPSKSLCPYCEETGELQQYAEKARDSNFPSLAKNYIDKRLGEIRRQDINIETTTKAPSYLPKNRNRKAKNYTTHDTISIFLMRDKLGKIDSYRFYKEYYMAFDREITDHIEIGKKPTLDILKKLELVMICILHEPKLFKVHKELLVNIHDKCKELLAGIMENDFDKSIFFYDWNVYALTRLLVQYHFNELANINFCKRVFNFAKQDPQSLEYLSFIFISNIRPLPSKLEIANWPAVFTRNLMVFHDDLKKMGGDDSKISADPKIMEVLHQLVKYVEPVYTENINQAFLILKNFFKTEYSRPLKADHSGSNHGELMELIGELQMSIGFEILDSDLSRIVSLIKAIWPRIRSTVMLNLNTIKKQRVICPQPAHIYAKLFDETDSIHPVLLRIDEAYHKFILQYESKEKPIESDKKLIREFYNLLFHDLQNGHFLSQCDFFIFCSKYYTDLESCINEAMNHPSVLECVAMRENFSISQVNDERHLVDAHPEFITYGLVKILQNAAKREFNNGASISFKIVFDPETCKTSLTVMQSTPFIKNEGNHYSGIEKEIIPIFEMFCGKGNVQLDRDAPFFTIKIIFDSPIILKD